MPDKNPVAIIGMGCLFPKSLDLKDYWQRLTTGEMPTYEQMAVGVSEES